MIAAPLLEPGARPVVGHRGAAGLAPENTLESFDLALTLGADALELDVRITADGIPVVCHDPTIDRTTNSTGEIGSLRWADVERLDAGAAFSADGRSFPFRDRGVRIPTLRSVLERYRETPLLIELKVAAAQLAVRDELNRVGAHGQVVLASFIHGALAAFREPPFLVGASRRDIIMLKIASSCHLPLGRPTAVAYAVPYRYRDAIVVPTRSFIRAADRLGRPVHVWTVDEPHLAARLWEDGVSGIVTNFPGRFEKREARSKKREETA